MSRYLVEAARADDPTKGPDLVHAELRCPEVAVERRYASHDGVGPDLWLCRAPSATHLRHWATAAGLAVRSVRQVNVATPGDVPSPARAAEGREDRWPQ